MEDEKVAPQPFRFNDPRQRQIYEELRDLVGPGPAAFFRDACWLMQNPYVLQNTSHLVGHFVREIDSAIRSVLKPIVPEKMVVSRILCKVAGAEKIL